MGIFQVLTEFLGEAVHILLINASYIGAGKSFLCETLRAFRRKLHK